MIVILTNIPSPYRTAFFDDLHAQAAEFGETVHVLYCAPTEPNRFWGYHPEEMKHPHTFQIRGLFTHLNLSVLRELKRLKPTTLIVGGAWNTPTILLAGLSRINPPPRRLFWSEGHAKAVAYRTGPIAWVRRRCYQKYQAFAVPNQLSADWALSQVGEPKPIVFLPNSVDVDFYSRNDPSAKARLVFVGTGPLESELKALADKSDGGIQLLGQMDAEGVRQILLAANVFVLNTKKDPNPLSPIEASAAGLTVLLSSMAGNVKEIITAGDAGMIIDDPMNPTAALRWVLSRSDEELESIGQRARAHARNTFSTKAVAKRLLEQLSSW
ncbi:MAG: glycosyltransferase [Verrucomicrobia bacterium]|nr:glycosyltransferase [Verrucomicrobiota bacterium]